jgi:hypothetical protein
MLLIPPSRLIWLAVMGRKEADRRDLAIMEAF